MTYLINSEVDDVVYNKPKFDSNSSLANNNTKYPHQ